MLAAGLPRALLPAASLLPATQVLARGFAKGQVSAGFHGNRVFSPLAVSLKRPLKGQAGRIEQVWTWC